MVDYNSFIDKLKAGSRFLIVSHYNPDGDGIGSTIALGIALEKMGKKVVLYNRDKLPDNLHFLPHMDKFVSNLKGNDVFDMAIMCDCAQRKRISDEFAALNDVSLYACIDHHLLDKAEADILLIDGEAASTGEVVLRLMKHAGVDIDPDIARCIYTTLVVDTGFFKYSNTTTHCLALASELVAAGAEPWVVAKHLEESSPLSRMKLLAASLSSLNVDLGGRYATMEVTQKMLKESGATIELSDEFATYPRAIGGVEVAALFREVEGDLTKVSMRSKDIVNVSDLAKSFGGGGHMRAAGFRVHCSLDEAKKKVLKAVEDVLKG